MKLKTLFERHNETQGGKEAKSSTHDIEIEILGDPVATLLELLVQSHDVQGVETVYDGGSHGRGAEYTGAVASLRYRSKLVFAPSVTHVVVPAVLHHL